MNKRPVFAARTDWRLEENAYSIALQRHRKSGEEILDLTASNPTACGFDYDEEAILGAMRSSAALRYDPQPKGLLSARMAVAEYYGEAAPGAAVDPERLILTTGTSEAYSFLFRLLCEAGDEVIVAHPSYPLFDFLASIHDVHLRPFRLVYDHGWFVDLRELKSTIGPRTRAILLVHPNNPTGNFIHPREAEELNLLCAAQGLALVVDEVFFDYELDANPAARSRHGSFASNVRALTFVLSGLSKISALPQMKVAWIAASGPEELVRDAVARLEVIADTYLSLSAPIQHALPVLLRQRKTMQPQIISRIKTNIHALDEQLAAQSLVSRLEVEGGWYAILRVPAIQSDEELAIDLIDRCSVAVHPGHFYNFSGDGYVVLSLLPRADDFQEGVRRALAHIGAQKTRHRTADGRELV